MTKNMLVKDQIIKRFQKLGNDYIVNWDQIVGYKCPEQLQKGNSCIVECPYKSTSKDICESCWKGFIENANSLLVFPKGEEKDNIEYNYKGKEEFEAKMENIRKSSHIEKPTLPALGEEKHINIDMKSIKCMEMKEGFLKIILKEGIDE